MSKPSYQKILVEARRAVREEYEHPFQGGYYDTQSVLVDLVNTFPTLDANNDDDEQLLRDAVHEAEQEFNERHGVLQ